MKNLSLLALALALGACSLNAQNNYYMALGGVGNEEAWQMVKTYSTLDPTNPEGEFMIVGYVQTATYTHGTTGARDGLVVRMKPNGTIIWAEAIGGKFDDEFRDIVYYQGAYYCVGITRSWEQFQKTQNPTTAGAGNIFLVKILDNGAVEWALHFGLPGNTTTPDWGVSIAETTSSGVVVAGVNNAASPTNSDVVAIRVMPNGAIAYAKRYHFQTGSNPATQTPDNVYDICRDAGLNHILTCGTRGIGTSNGDGVILKIDINGNPVWPQARRLMYNNTNDVGESTVVNLRNNLLYNSGHHSPAGANFPPPGDGKEYLIYTLKQNDGLASNVAGVPAARRYPWVGSAAQQRKRGKLYPRNAYGFYGTTYGATADLVQLDAMDAVIFAFSDSLEIIWQHSYGWPGYYDYFNHVLDCTDNNDLFCIGATRSRTDGRSTHNYDLFIGRFNHDGLIPPPPANTCVANPLYDDPAATYTNSGTPVITSNLNVGNCTGLADCWADSNKISDIGLPIDLKPYLIFSMVCPTGGGGGGGGGTLASPDETFPPKVTVIPCEGCPKDLSFTFGQGLLSVEFTISDDNGYKYYETTNVNTLTTGIKYSDLGLGTGTYIWKLTAPHPTGVVEQHQGTITIP